MKTTILAAAAASLLAGPALAHISLDEGEAAAGATTKVVLRIGHGCDGKATTGLRVTLPDGFYNAKPMPKAGWTLETETGDYARPFDNHGTEMTKGLREIRWSGGDLPDAYYDEFVLRGTVGPEVVPGAVLYFPTVQECGKDKTAWIDVTGGDAAEHPAPGLTVTAASADAGHGGHHMAGMNHEMAGHDMAGHDMAGMDMGHDAGAAPVRLGDLEISGGFARATPPGAEVGGGFLTIRNDGSADRLVSASSPLAARVEIHEMAMQDNVMTMRPLPDGLALPAGETVALKPGGFHLMLMGLKQPLAEGETVPLTLTFEKAGSVDAALLVGKINARAAGGEHGQQ